jgi:hypothetical protein
MQGILIGILFGVGVIAIDSYLNYRARDRAPK